METENAEGVGIKNCDNKDFKIIHFILRKHHSQVFIIGFALLNFKTFITIFKTL